MIKVKPIKHLPKSRRRTVLAVLDEMIEMHKRSYVERDGVVRDKDALRCIAALTRAKELVNPPPKVVRYDLRLVRKKNGTLHWKD